MNTKTTGSMKALFLSGLMYGCGAAQAAPAPPGDRPGNTSSPGAQPAPTSDIVSGAAKIPSCRLIPTPRIAQETARRLLERMRSKPEIAATVGPSAVDVLIVKDALQSEVDSNGCLKIAASAIEPDTLLRLDLDVIKRAPGSLDTWSVRGACQAIGREVRCSSAALELMLAKDESATFSPTLTYVLGHELGHIALGHTRSGSARALAEATPGADAKSRLDAALAACSAEPQVIELETAADALAAEVLEAELAAQHVDDDRAFDGFRAVYSWLLHTAGQSARIERGPSFCAYLNAPPDSPGVLYGGTHPRWAARIAAVAKASGVIDAKALGLAARGDDLFASRFCDQARRFEAKQFDCSQAAAEGARVEMVAGAPTMLLVNEPADTKIAAKPTGEPVLDDGLVTPLCKASPKNCNQARRKLVNCKTGHTDACESLADDFSAVLGREHTTPLHYFACLHGASEACNSLVQLSLNGLVGDSGKPEPPSARKWAFKSCALGNSEGCMAAADIFYNTQFMNGPRLFALGLLARGCELDHPLACQRLQELTAIRDALREATKLPFAIVPYEQLPN